MRDEFLVIVVTHQAGSCPVTWEFPSWLDFQISGRWMQNITEFQLQAPYRFDRASSQLLGRPWRISVRCVVFD